MKTRAMMCALALFPSLASAAGQEHIRAAGIQSAAGLRTWAQAFAVQGTASTGTAAAQAKQTPAEPEYVIGPRDVLVVEVWQDKEFSGPVTVRPDGKITLPLVNDIPAAGLTPTDLAATIKKLLVKYVTNPQVTVKVEQINSKIIFVMGEVTKPGPVTFLSDMTVLQALALAGGPTQYANPKKMYVLRNENGKQTRFPFNYKKAIRGGDLQQNIMLKPGDTVVVP